MNTREELLAKLLANEPFSKIRTEVHSTSKLYEVSGQFLDERQTQLEKLGLRIRQAEKERDGLEAQVESLRRESGNCRQEKQELEQENSRLTDDFSEKTTELNLLKERIDGFRAQGFKPEVMDKLESMVDRGGEELLKQLWNID